MHLIFLMHQINSEDLFRNPTKLPLLLCFAAVKVGSNFSWWVPHAKASANPLRAAGCCWLCESIRHLALSVTHFQLASMVFTRSATPWHANDGCSSFTQCIPPVIDFPPLILRVSPFSIGACGLIIVAQTTLRHSSSSTAAADAWSFALSEDRHILVSFFECESRTAIGITSPLTISSSLFAKMRKPPCDEPSGLTAQTASV